MTLFYVAGFQVATSTSMTCTIAGSGVTVADGLYSHTGFDNGVDPLARQFTAFDAAVQAAAPVGTAVAFDLTTGLYTISRAGAFTMTFSSGTDSDVRLAHALGFTPGGSYTGATSYTSDKRPYYLMGATEPARSQALPFVYEADDVVEEAVSDDGEAYGVAKDTHELLSDWTQPMEPKASTFTTAAASSAPWTWQDFFKHCRMTYPFLINEGYDGASTGVYQLRADGARFKAMPVVSDWDSLYNIKFVCRYLGTND